MIFPLLAASNLYTLSLVFAVSVRRNDIQATEKSAMRRVIAKFRPSVAFVGLSILCTVCFVLFDSRPPRPIEVGIVGESTFVITNTTSREIRYRLASQFKCEGVWAEVLLPPDYDIQGYVIQGVGQPGLRPIPGKRLPAGSFSTANVSRPRNITAPLDATAWRLAVVWRYAAPTRVQDLRNQAVELITGRLPPPYLESSTNFSQEISL